MKLTSRDVQPGDVVRYMQLQGVPPGLVGTEWTIASIRTDYTNAVWFTSGEWDSLECLELVGPKTEIFDQ